MNFWKETKKPILALAPMAGFTDSAFRKICKKFGADVVYTEMISADALYYQDKKTLKMLKFSRQEKPIVCQLFGSRIKTFPRACKIIEKAGYDGIDLNFGCPVKKIVRQGSGITLMKDLAKCQQIISTVIKSTKLPVSVKTRSSIQKITLLNFLKKINKLDIKALVIHGRSYEKPFTGPINYAIIKESKKYFKGIILANGGIYTPQDAEIALGKTKADGIALARGALGRPWLFQEIKNYLDIKIKYCVVPKNINQKKKIILQHARLNKNNLLPFRKHLLAYTKGWPNSKKLRQKLVQVENIGDLKKILQYPT